MLLLDPDTLEAGESGVLTILGDGTSFDETTVVDLGEDVAIDDVRAGSAGWVAATVTVAPDAAAGPRTLTIVTGDEQVVAADVFTVLSVGAAAPEVWLSDDSLAGGQTAVLRILADQPIFNRRTPIALCSSWQDGACTPFTGFLSAGTELIDGTILQAIVKIDRYATDQLRDQATAYVAGRWYHVAYDIDFDQATFREWVDGVLILSGPFALEDVPCALAGGQTLSFHGGAIDQKYLGHVDDVQVVDYPAGCARPNGALWSATQDARVRVIDTAGLFTSTFTVEMWAHFDSFADTDPGQRLITAIGSGSYELLYLRAYQGNFECVIGTGDGVLAAQVPVAQMQAGRWTHVACTHDDAELALWLDGRKVGTAAGLPYGIPADSALGLAGDHREPPDTAQQFLGKIDEVRFSDVVEYTDTFTPQPRLGPTPSTLALWHFDECAGTTAADSVSPGAHEGTLEHGADWDVP